MKVIRIGKKKYGNDEKEIITDAILYAEEDWFYPVIDGIPRLLVEAFIDYSSFFEKHMDDYKQRSNILYTKHAGLLQYVLKKNSRTKKSFEYEWQIFNYEKDKTWNANQSQMLERFYKETGECDKSINSKVIFDVGCGNGLLNSLIAAKGAIIVGMDLSKSVENAFKKNKEPGALFIQGDLQFPPAKANHFDIVHCSGVLIHTNNTKQSFFSIESCVKENGKFSVWLYHPRKDKIHNFILRLRKGTSKLPVLLQHFIYKFIFFPPLFVIKWVKGHKPKYRELMVALMDQFSPEFRWEHEPEEVKSWFHIKNYSNIEITTKELFGYNITGIKNEKDENSDF